MIDLFKLSREQLDRYIHLQSLVARQQEKADKVIAARDYYDGDHPTLLSQRQIEFLGPQLTSGEYGFNHNLIRVVIDTLRERLNVTGFTVNGKGADTTTPEGKLAGLLWEWWKQNRMESQQIRLYRRALRDGLAYVMVDYDNDYQRPRFALHEVDDGVTGISLHRDPSDENCTLFSTRYFATFDPLTVGETGKARKTVYLASEIRKYLNVGANTWIEIRDPLPDTEAKEDWPIPWLDWEGKPLGVATVEFQNPGGSEVELLAGLQNALNKAWLDLLAAADMSGFPILTANYREPQLRNVRDDDDNQTGADEFKIAPSRLLEIFGGTIGRIEGANLDHMIKLVWTTVDAISGVSRTPASFMKPFAGVDVPSGEALKQLESGLVAKAKERQLVFGESWADVMGLAYRVARTFGRNVPDVKDPVIGVQWAEAATRMEKSEAEIAKILKDLGLPDQAVWERAGFSPEQIASFIDIVAEKRKAELASVVSAMNQPTAVPVVQPAVQPGGNPL